MRSSKVPDEFLLVYTGKMSYFVTGGGRREGPSLLSVLLFPLQKPSADSFLCPRGLKPFRFGETREGERVFSPITPTDSGSKNECRRSKRRRCGEFQCVAPGLFFRPKCRPQLRSSFDPLRL